MPLLLVTALVMAPIACGDDSDDSTDVSAGDDRRDDAVDRDDGNDVADDDGDDGPDEAAAAELVGRTFLSESVTEDGDERPLVDGTRIRLEFPEPGRLAWGSGCNHFGGQVTVGTDRLEIEVSENTDMGCEPAGHDQDDWLAALLASDPGYELDDDRLVLTAADTVVELVDEEVVEPDLPLEGTTWRLETIIESDVASSVPDGAEATLVFEDGRVGMDVCNVGGSAVDISDGEIEVEGMVSTMMACGPPQDEVESAVMAVLDGTITYAVDGNRLTLSHPGGRGLVLVAAEDDDS